MSGGGKDPRIGALADFISSDFYEGISAQASGVIKAVLKDCLKMKSGKDIFKAVIKDEDRLFVAKVTIERDGEKKAENISLKDVKAGDFAKVNLNLLPSGEWELLALTIRNR